MDFTLGLAIIAAAANDDQEGVAELVASIPDEDLVTAVVTVAVASGVYVKLLAKETDMTVAEVTQGLGLLSGEWEAHQ